MKRLSFASAAVFGLFGTLLAIEGKILGASIEWATVPLIVAAGLHAERARSVDRAAKVWLLVVTLNTLVFSAAQGGLRAITAMWGGIIVVAASLLVGVRFSRALAIGYGGALIAFAVLHHQGVAFPTWGSTGTLWYVDRAAELVALVTAGAFLSEGLHGTFGRAIARERRDARRLAEAGERLHQVTRELEEARRAPSPEVASLSHDVRNLLGAARMELELLRESVPDAEESVAGALEAVRGATDLTRAMVASESGVQPRPAAELRQVAEAVAKVARGSSGRLARIEVEVPMGLRVVGPARDLERVLLNLVLNALEAQPPEAPWVRISGSADPADPGAVVVDVADAGPGVPESLRSRLFERGVSLKGAGRGTGLSGARTVIEELGGTLRYVASAGPGALFQLRVPRSLGDPTDAADTVS